MPARLRIALTCALLVVGLALIAFAQDAPSSSSISASASISASEPKHGAMEFFGMGPELFENRAKAWVLAFAGIVKAAISELGLVLLAVYALREVVKQKGKLKEQVAEVHTRLDRQRQDIDANKATIAGAAVAAGTAPPPATTWPVS